MQRHQHFVFALAAILTARALAQDLPPTDESLAAYADTTHSVTLADGREIHFVWHGCRLANGHSDSGPRRLGRGLEGGSADARAHHARLRMGPAGFRLKRRELGPSDGRYDHG
jgi:hypothetical protein